jgi:hypothetical protein
MLSGSAASLVMPLISLRLRGLPLSLPREAVLRSISRRPHSLTAALRKRLGNSYWEPLVRGLFSPDIWGDSKMPLKLLDHTDTVGW